MLNSRLRSGSPFLAALQTFAVLFNVRTVFLLIYAGVAGAFLTARGYPPFSGLLMLVFGGGAVSFGAALLNQYVERDQDALMDRTKARLLASGAVARPQRLRNLGILMMVLPTAVVLPLNPTFALLTALGAILYVVVYTMWLKPRAVFSSFAAGLAASTAVLAGGAAASGAASGRWMDPGVLGLAAVVFFWCPVHSWSLGLAHRSDYARTTLPVLPVRFAPRRAASWLLVHALAAAGLAIALGAHPALGPAYLVPAALLQAMFLPRVIELAARPTTLRAGEVLQASNVYLGLLLLSVTIGVLFPVHW